MEYIAVIILVLASFNAASAEVNVCNNVTDGIFLANLTDCEAYIVCYGGKAYGGQCPDDYYFDPKTQRCDVASKTQCVKTCTSALSSFPYDGTCTKFVMCFDSTPIVQECLDNLQYNAETDRCDLPQNVDCQANMCTSVNDPNNIVYLASHELCSKYYICYNGAAVPMNCSEGLYFNLAKKGCDYKANVSCTISAKSRAVMPYSKVPPTRANISCPKQGTFFYPKEDDTSSYYFCMNGNGVILNCSPGLYYDRKMESCREPRNISN